MKEQVQLTNFSCGALRASLLAIVSVCLVGCATYATHGAATAQATGGTQATTSSLQESYRLGPEDQIRLIVYGEPDLSGEFTVNDQGKIVFPLIGDVDVGDATIEEAKLKIEAQLADGFLNEADVAAEIIRFRPYYILGEITRPGKYEYSAGLTVMKAIAAAEGFTYRANKSAVFIQRFDQAGESRVKLNAGTRVFPGDVVRIGERFF